MKSIHTVYVQNNNSAPLMPTRPAKAKWLLKHGKAKVVQTSPFTIRLTYLIEHPIIQPAELVIDDGETVGVALIQHNKTHQRVIFAAEMRCRGREIKDLLKQRKRLRRDRKRRGWQRRNKIKPRPQRLPPSIKADVDAKIRLVNRIAAIIPISTILWEALKLDLNKKQPGQRYKQGIASSVSSEIKESALRRDGHRCCLCQREVISSKSVTPLETRLETPPCESLQVSNGVMYRIAGRTNRFGNLITLCQSCFLRVQRESIIVSLSTLNMDLRGAGRCMAGKNEFGRQLKAISIPIMLVSGWRTQQCAQKMGLKKSHVNDAIAIGCRGEACLMIQHFYQIRLRARHQRKLFFENPGDLDIQSILKDKTKHTDAQYNKRFRSLRRRVRRRLYRKRYGKSGVKAKKQQLGYCCEPFAPNYAIYVKKDGTRGTSRPGRGGIIKNPKIYKKHQFPKKKEIATLFFRGDIVKTEEGMIAEVLTLFSSGKVGIQFVVDKRRTARIPETLSLLERRQSMQFHRFVLDES
jgi:hypothetical protein